MIDAPSELLSFLREEEERCEDTELAEKRELALSFYRGELFGDEEDGCSQVVTRDVAETVDYMAISILRTMVSGDKVVECEARDPEQVEAAAEMTEAVTDSFMRQQAGYRILSDWLKTGLLEKTGFIKTWVEQRFVVRKYTVAPEALAEIDPASIVSAGQVDPLLGDESPWSVAIREPLPPRFLDEAVPNEEMLVAPDARTLDEPVYIAHRLPMSLSGLREMGFALEDEDALYDEAPANNLSRARDNGRSGRDEDVVRTGSNRRVWLLEEYPLYDLNGDGIAERLCVHRVGSKVLSIVEVEDHPFEYWTPFPMQHRLVGESLADKVMDIQRIRSVILRQNLDGLYDANQPRAQIPQEAIGENTIDDWMTPGRGVLVRTKGSGTIQRINDSFDVGSGMSMLELMTGERESRTGITRLNQGLDADALNKTATGTALMQAQGQQIEEYLARNFAEGVARLFRKKLRLMREHGAAMMLRIDGEFRRIDPSQWSDDPGLVVRVGLGSGRKEQRLQYRMMLLDIIKEGLAAGLPIVNIEKLYNALTGLVGDAGIGDVNQYFVDPATLGEMPERPDPEAAKAEAAAQVEMARIAAGEEKAKRDHELRMMEAQASIQLKREEAALDAQLKRDKAAEEARLAEAKMEREWALALRKAEREERLSQSLGTNDDDSLPGYRPGGDLAA